jgi:dTDP-glucose 4,6-dehydratase
MIRHIVATKATVAETYNSGDHNKNYNIDVVKASCELLEELPPNNCPSPAGVNSEGFESLITYVKGRAGHDVRYVIDSSKIEKESGWTPNETFEGGIRKTLECYLNNQQFCQHIQDGSYQRERLGQLKC